jgi:hypothetical protein
LHIPIAHAPVAHVGVAFARTHVVPQPPQLDTVLNAVSHPFASIESQFP